MFVWAKICSVFFVESKLSHILLNKETCSLFKAVNIMNVNNIWFVIITTCLSYTSLSHCVSRFNLYWMSYVFNLSIYIIRLSITVLIKTFAFSLLRNKCLKDLINSVWLKAFSQHRVGFTHGFGWVGLGRDFSVFGRLGWVGSTTAKVLKI